jgi:hypothetical protein
VPLHNPFPGSKLRTNITGHPSFIHNSKKGKDDESIAHKKIFWMSSGMPSPLSSRLSAL